MLLAFVSIYLGLARLGFPKPGGVAGFIRGGGPRNDMPISAPQTQFLSKKSKFIVRKHDERWDDLIGILKEDNDNLRSYRPKGELAKLDKKQLDFLPKMSSEIENPTAHFVAKLNRGR